MRQVSTFANNHEDFMHDVAYDHYGTRLATCSSDHKIKVWSETASGGWQCDAELSGHRGAVWKLAWAHPEFGQVLASCSFDQQIIIWEELDAPPKRKEAGSGEDAAGTSTGASAGQAAAESNWKQLAKLKGDGRESVNDMQFAPRHFGLCLATCSTDGAVRLYTAEDVMNLETWSMSEKFKASSEKVRGDRASDTTSISWNQSRFDQQMLVVGNTNRIIVWSRSNATRRWEMLHEVESASGSGGAINDVCWAPNLGRSYHLIAAARSNCDTVEIWKLVWNPETSKYDTFTKEADLDTKSEAWRCEWNVTGTVLATSGDDGVVRLWRKNFANSWDLVAEESLK
ncbi:Protein transport protein SEC13 [Hondaea fermentalgiana]|uniref:Protein transport protein SEC13 n=1 Tax=Hondaea fermentalgiana TaxID=2315210 RepID=A0A2R5G9E8_9STRA|nr:Protein transport protein SEC13 [Hondaea fermentalgiana]|eukprot:GBG27692.1 Protein transport protein SEC13 [Hondaea fermentalgiana]